MIEFWVGVDGGGTHTRARIRDRAGKLLGEGRAAGSNLELGIPHAHANVLAAIASARLAAGIAIESEQQMGVGLALASAELADCYHALLEMPFPFASVRLTSDAFGACLGAFGGREGAILIAGTGSVGLVYQEGQIRTCSGRGFPISDIGSGAWLGLRAIQQSLLCHDGILPPSTLAIRLMDRFKRDQAEVVRWAARAIPADYGHFAPLGIRCRQRWRRARQSAAGRNLRTAADPAGGNDPAGCQTDRPAGGDWHPPRSPSRPAQPDPPQADALDGAILFAQSEDFPCLHP
ncbi:BadF/BadG/BcrA/BcrD ATPase family protein [Aeromonas veronii]|uniref:BadF/BadG/BcrA/BcrD ATPase family protein n=1 Tax=Aeromonas veronii TaxID=654 RepID=UPI0036703EF8